MMEWEHGSLIDLGRFNSKIDRGSVSDFIASQRTKVTVFVRCRS